MGRRKVIDEPRLLKMEGGGVLEVFCLADGWEDPGVCHPVDEAYPPEEQLEFSVVKVELVFEGVRIDLTRQFELGNNLELRALVEDIASFGS